MNAPIVKEWKTVDKVLDFTLTKGESTKLFQFHPRTSGNWRIAGLQVEPLDLDTAEAKDTVRFLGGIAVRVFHADRIHMERPLMSLARRMDGQPLVNIEPPLEFDRRESPLMELRASPDTLPPEGRRVRLYICVAEEA